MKKLTRRERLMEKIDKLEEKWEAFENHHELKLKELDKEYERKLRTLEREWDQYDDKINKEINKIDRQLQKLPDDTGRCRR